MNDDQMLPWIPTPKEVAALRKLIEDQDATIATLRAEVAALKTELKGRGTWAIVDGLNQRID